MLLNFLHLCTKEHAEQAQDTFTCHAIFLQHGMQGGKLGMGWVVHDGIREVEWLPALSKRLHFCGACINGRALGGALCVHRDLARYVGSIAIRPSGMRSKVEGRQMLFRLPKGAEHHLSHSFTLSQYCNKGRAQSLVESQQE